MRHYTLQDCLRKTNQEWEMAGLARLDGDSKDEARHTAQAKLWAQRAKEGGYTEEKHQ